MNASLYLRFVLVVVLFCGTVRGYGARVLSSMPDERVVDSLKTALEGKVGVARSEVLRELAFLYADVDNKVALSYIEEANEALENVAVDSLWFVKMHRIRAQLLKRMVRYTDAIQEIQYTLPVAQRNQYDDECEALWNTLALCYFYLGDYSKSILLQFENLRLRQARESSSVVVSYNNIGLLYYKLGDYHRAKDYFQKALISIGQDSTDIVGLYFNIALCYNYLGDHPTALDYALEGQRVCRADCVDSFRMDGELTLGLIYSNMGRDSLALLHSFKAYELAIRINDCRRQAEALVCFGRVLNNTGDYTRSTGYLRKAVDNALCSGVKVMLEQSYFELSRSHYGLENFEDAVRSREMSRIYHDSLFDERVANVLTVAQVDFEQEKSKHRLGFQESIIVWQERRNTWIVVVGGLLVVAIGVMYYDARERRLENAKLEVMVRSRTVALEERVRGAEVRDVALGECEKRLDLRIREGGKRLEGLGGGRFGIGIDGLMES